IRRILDSVSEPVLALDREWRIQFANHRAEHLVGLSREELAGKPAAGVYPFGREVGLLAHCERALRENARVEVEIQLRDGRWYEIRACPFDEGVSVYLHDVTLQKQAVEALESRAAALAHSNAQIQQIEERLQLALRAGQMGWFDTDPVTGASVLSE